MGRVSVTEGRQSDRAWGQVPELACAYLRGLRQRILWGCAENPDALTFKILSFMLFYFCGMF